MIKRTVAGVLWIYALWWAWSLYAGLAGLDLMWGPILAVAITAFVLVARALLADRPRQGVDASSLLASSAAAAHPEAT